MPHIYSLAYLTSAPMAPPEAIALAAGLGYQAIGARIAASTPGGGFSPLTTDAAMLRDTLRRIADTGVGIFDVEIVRLGPHTEIADFAALLETAGRLQARAVLVAGDDPDEARLTGTFAAFCRAAAPYGLTADLEFMPWTAVKNANAALRIVRGAGEPNGRVLVDALHAARSATTLDDIAALPRALLSYAQLCDAPGEIPATDRELLHTARSARLLPGDGGIDLDGIVRRLPDDLPFSLEIPNDEWLPKLGAEEWARRALAAARRIVDGAAREAG